jgi:Spy/CpxP family protein refolding chaperone
MRPSTLLLPAAFANKLSSTASTAATATAAGPLDRHNHHCHHRGRTHRRTLAKKA